MSVNSVIAAISTPPGKGGVAVIRVSGDGAVGVCDKMFRAFSGKKLSEIPPRTQVYGAIFSGETRVDDGMATVFYAPHSYTGEDTVEISCHGGILITRTVLESVLAAGARLAGPGEFTRRAYLNGKLTLTAAEAIGTLLDAGSMEQIKLSNLRSRDNLTLHIDGIRTELTGILSSLFARIDYPDEDLGSYTAEEMLSALTAVEGRVRALLATYRTGSAIVEGVRTVIVGKPNVGKSSLYNLLVGEDAAIVTDTAGTTRDCLEKSVPLGKVMLHLIDTAGLREATDDPIERIGMERAKSKLAEAQLVIAVFDASQPFDAEDKALLDALGSLSACKIALLNKADLGTRVEFSEPDGLFSACVSGSVRGNGQALLTALSAEVERLFTDERIVIGEDAILTSARQNAALLGALSHITDAIGALRVGIAQDAAASEVELALAAIGELDGRTVTDAVVSDIFAKFCVGK